MPHGDATEILTTYLEDAILAEASMEVRLRSFASHAGSSELEHLFAESALECRRQKNRLAECLQKRGGTTPEHSLQPAVPAESPDNMLLALACSAENSEVATYEALALAAAAAADSETEGVARTLQAEKRATAMRAWRVLGPEARNSLERLTLKAA